MPGMTRRDLSKQGSRIKSTIHIGKEGITDGVIEEIRLQIGTREQNLLDLGGDQGEHRPSVRRESF
ncbi:MAG: YhbY family RNA-binding protein [Acidobacteriia bacterium]|nr:YhbY family RNA-binding protein [Terriglobia bacterium]